MFYKDGEIDIDKFKEFFELPGDINDLGRKERIKEKILQLRQLKIQIKEYQDATENFENEQKVVRDKLDEVSQELAKLEEKLARKKTQMDGNLCKITKK
jgi:chromosome segregation ATPase